MDSGKEIIIYQTDDGKANVTLIAKDDKIWMNQNQIAELFKKACDGGYAEGCAEYNDMRREL
ncbi:MAG: hypothetical protein ACOX2F_12755 [bacterium]